MGERKLVVGIIGGRGKIGRILKGMFRRNGAKVIVAGRRTRLTKEELVVKSDVVIFSVPLIDTVKVIQEVSPYVRENHLLVDTTSMKRDSLSAMLKTKASIIGIHPMFFSISSLAGQTMLVIPSRPGTWEKWMLGIFRKEGMQTVVMDGKNHDRVMAVLQVINSLSFAAMAHTIAKISRKHGISMQDLLNIGGNTYRLRFGLMSRVLSQPEVYADISMLNHESPEVLVEYVKSVNRLLSAIKKKDKEGYVQYFNEAREFLGVFNKEGLKQTNYLIEELGRMKFQSKKKEKKK